MAEYSIGSLADLISGTKTPNKITVVKKNYVQPVPVISPKAQKKPRESVDKTITEKTKKTKHNFESTLDTSSENQTRPKKNKKRKVLVFGEDGVTEEVEKRGKKRNCEVDNFSDEKEKSDAVDQQVQRRENIKKPKRNKQPNKVGKQVSSTEVRLQTMRAMR